MMSQEPCDVRSLNLVTYENGMAMQERLVSLRQKGEIPDQLLLLEHPPVITLGRGGDRGNVLVPEDSLLRSGIRFYETTRGGDVTYHGPGQIVGYPILHLGEGRRDVRKYVTRVEEVLIRTAMDFGIEAERVEGKRGIWVGNRKLAAIGVRIARWVTSHGFAFNVNTDLTHFRNITPCGLHGTGVTSVEELLGHTVSPDEVRKALTAHFGAVFERELTPRDHTIPLVKIVPYADEHVLLFHRHDLNLWQPITGSVEPGESAIEAARREFLEETGHEARELVDLHLRQSFLIDSDLIAAAGSDLAFADEIAFASPLDAGVPITLDEEEHDAHRWFTFSEALRTIHWTDDREAIERLGRMAIPEAAGRT